jgi:hypothetical protein
VRGGRDPAFRLERPEPSSLLVDLDKPEPRSLTTVEGLQKHWNQPGPEAAAQALGFSLGG